MTQRLARIVPADPDSPLVRGVKVIQADGSTIRGIKRLTLVAEPNSLWTAKIEMNVLPPAGIAAEYEATDISSTDREFESAASIFKPQTDELYRLYVARTRAMAQAMVDNTTVILKTLDDIQFDLNCRPPHDRR